MARMIGEVTQEELSQELQVLMDKTFSLTGERGYLTTTRVADNTDFNTIVNNGLYWCNAWVHPNIPTLPDGTRVTGVVRVEKDSDNIVYQTLITDKAPIMFRTLRNGTWSQWENFITERTVKNFVSNPNLLINGDFKIWQMGSSFSDRWGRMYFADQWVLWSNKETTVSIHTIGTSDKVGHRACKIVPAQTTADGSIINIMQPLESKIINNNNKLTLSFWVKCEGCGETTQISSRIAVSDNLGDIDAIYDDVVTMVKGDGWTKVEATFDTSRLTSEKTLTIIPFRRGGCTKGQVFYLMDVKLELGDKATKFVPKSHSQELMDCKRYYEIIPVAFTEPQKVYSCYKGIVIRSRSFFPTVEKRITPTYSIATMRTTGTHDISYANEIGGGATGLANIEVERSGNFGSFSIFIKDFSVSTVAGDEKVIYMDGAGKTGETKGIKGIIADARWY